MLLDTLAAIRNLKLSSATIEDAYHVCAGHTANRTQISFEREEHFSRYVSLVAYCLCVALQNAVACIVEEDEGPLLVRVVNDDAVLDLISENLGEGCMVAVPHHDNLRLLRAKGNEPVFRAHQICFHGFKVREAAVALLGSPKAIVSIAHEYEQALIRQENLILGLNSM